MMLERGNIMKTPLLPMYDSTKHKEIEEEINRHSLSIALDVIRTKIERTHVSFKTSPSLTFDINENEKGLIQTHIMYITKMFLELKWTFKIEFIPHYHQSIVTITGFDEQKQKPSVLKSTSDFFKSLKQKENT